MAKRRRLTPANPAVFGAEPAPEVKNVALSRAPIADVASDAAATAALDQMSQELTAARAQGRMVLDLPLAQIVLDHLVRDRIVADEPEMEDLMASIAARGQQTPVDVVELGPGSYGLISGWRRCQAIAALAEDGRHEGRVLALLRRPAEASDAYLSMVEENEIRVGLSYFERARIALKAVEQGVFESEKAALLVLFANASRPKRSKIRAFLPLVTAFEGRLGFPHLIGERLGLKLATAMDQDPTLVGRVLAALEAEAVETGPEEQALLQRFVTEPAAPKAPTPASPKAARPSHAETCEQIGPDLEAVWSEEGTWLRLSGPGMTPALRQRLLAFLHREEG